MNSRRIRQISAALLLAAAGAVAGIEISAHQATATSPSQSPPPHALQECACIPRPGSAIR